MEGTGRKGGKGMGKRMEVEGDIACPDL